MPLSSLASPTCFAILGMEGLQEMLPILRADASVEPGALFDTLSLAMLEGHNDASRLDRTAKRVWRAVVGDAPSVDPDGIPSVVGWESVRSKLDRSIARAKDALARSLAHQSSRIAEEAGVAPAIGASRTVLSAVEDADMEARWAKSGRRVPGEIFSPSSGTLALMARYLWPVGRSDSTEGLVVRPSSMEWPAKEQAPLEVIATRKGLHFRKVGSAGALPVSAYGVVERFEAKILAAEMILCGRDAPLAYTCEAGEGRTPLSERTAAQTCELLRTLLSTAGGHADALAIMLSAVNRLDEDVRDCVRQKMSPGAALMASWPTLRAQIVQVDREGQREGQPVGPAAPVAAATAASLEALLSALGGTSAAPVGSAGALGPLLAGLLAGVPSVGKQRKGAAAGGSGLLSGAARSQLNNFMQQVAKGGKAKKPAAKPASPKVDPALAALVTLLKGKLGSSSSDAATDKCKHFADTGKCKYGEKCRYAH